MVIKTGPGKWARFFLSSASGTRFWGPSGAPQATAFWGPSGAPQRVDPPPKIRVLINLDETSVRLVPEEGKGHVGNRAYRLLCSGTPLGRNASLAAQRSAITHLTAICDHPEIQNRLPQVVLVGENQVTDGRAYRLRSEAPASVHLWREKKAWVTTELMVKYILLLGRSVQEFQTTHRFIVYVDALRAHVSPKVLRAASRANLWICVIPSKMTWALQPCDTHCFASYKRLLGEEYQRRSGLTAAGDMTWELLLQSLWHVVTTLVQGKDWSGAFDSVGIRGEQRALSARTRIKLQYPLAAPQVQASLPPLSDFEYIWPKRLKIPIHEVFLPVERFLRGLPPEALVEEVAPKRPDSACERKSGGQVKAWIGRTRSTSSLASSLSAPAAQAEPSSAAPALDTQPAPLPPTTAPAFQSSRTESAGSSSLPPPLSRHPVGRQLPWLRTLPRT